MTAPLLPGPRHVLVVKLSALGDVVHVTPCLRALRRAWPATRITMAVDRRFAAIVREHPALDAVIEADAPPGRITRWLEPWRRLGRRGRSRFDLAIDFQGTRRSALWVYASGARVRAGRLRGDGPGREWRPGWQCVVRPDHTRHAVRVCADVAEAVGVPVDHLDPELHVSTEGVRRCAARVAEGRLPAAAFVLVNPFTSWPSKSWPVERYEELVRRLARDRNVPIVVHAGPGEEAGLARFAAIDGVRSGVAVVGGLPLEESLALFRRARLMVTGDTGPMHCAAALGVPIVALFGPTWPERTGPWGARHRVIQRSRPSTHHAFRTDVEGRHIRAIDVDTVHGAVLELLDREEPAR